MPLTGANGRLLFEFDSMQNVLRLIQVDINGQVASVGPEACSLSSRTIGELSPLVTVVEMTLDCPEVEVDERGVVPLDGSIVVDVTAFPARGLQ